jgi:hypothetical protein
VEEKDVHLEPDEDKDVEGHVNQVHTEADEAVHTAADDEDVEGHVHYAVNQGVNQAADAVQLGREDEDDDVEGHVNLN